MTVQATSTQVHQPHPAHVAGTSLLHPYSRGFLGGVRTSGFVAARAGGIRGYFDEPGTMTRCTVILSGACSMHAGGQTHHFQACDLVLARTAPDAFTFEHSAAFSALEIHMPPGLSEQMHLTPPSGITARPMGERGSVIRSARQLFGHLHTATAQRSPMMQAEALVGYGLAMTVLGHAFARNGGQATTPDMTKNAAGLDAARQALLERFDSAPAIADLAAISGLSQTRFKELFRQRFGCAPFALYQAHRMGHACQLLKEKNVTETAMELGYSNVSHFSAAFQREFGCPPGRWQRLMG